MAGRNLGDAFVVIWPDISQFVADLTAKATAAIKAVKLPPVTVPVTADTKAFDATIAGLQARMKAVSGQLATMRLDADDKALTAKIGAMQARAMALAKQMSALKMDADDKALVAKVAAVTKQISDLNEKLDDLTADVDIDAAVTKLYALEAQLKLLQSEAENIDIGGDPAKLAAFDAAILALERDTSALADSGKKVQAVPVFQAGWWNGAVMGISFWHIALDAAIEATIILTTTTLALGAAAAVAAPALDQVGYATEHSLQAMTALGTDAGPLAGKLDAVQKAMAPQVIEAYGGALTILTGQTGALAKTGAEVVTGFDDVIARVDIWMKTQKDMGGLLQSGVGFLSQMAKILGTLAEALDNLLQKDPGIAKFLLELVQLAADAINVFSKLPAPIVEAALAIHGLYLWVSVLVVAPVLKMAEALGILSAEQTAAAASGLKFKSMLGFLLTNPYGWAIAAAAALAYLAYEGNQADNATRGLITQQESALSAMNASQAATTGLAQAIGRLNAAEQGTSAAQIESSWHGVSGAITMAGDKVDWFGHEFAQITQGSALHELGAIADIAHGLIAPGFAAAGAATNQYQNDIAALNGELAKLRGSYTNLYAETGNLMRSGYDLQQSFALLDMAGVKWNDSLALMEQKVTNLIHGYQDMSVGGGILTNSINAMNFATEQQDSKITALNSAWDTFFKTVSGGATGFDAFATQSEGLYASMSQGADKLTVSNGKASISLQATTAAAQKGAPSITGLTTADLQLRDSFVQTAGAASTQMDNLTLMASAAGLGAKGTDMLTQATKDMVAQMLPAAKGSQEMTAILYALAQRGGYEGADSFQALAKWVGNTQDPMANLDKITTQLTVDSANLLKDVQNLSVALGQTLNTAMATAIFTASGGQKTFDTFADSVLRTGTNSKTTKDAAQKLADQLYLLTGSTSSAEGEFVAFAEKGLGLTQSQAETLWKTTLPGLKNAINELPGNKTIKVTMTGDGKYTITGPGQVAPYPVKAAAAGMYLHPNVGTPGQDSVLVRAMPGELIVPANMVPAVAPLLGGKIPGFAAGGLPAPVSVSGALTPTFVSGMYTDFSQHLTTAMVAAMKTGITAATQAAQAALGSPVNYSHVAGVTQWEPDVLQVLAMLGLPVSDLPTVMAQIQTESGGNPNAINLSDINAQRGDPSKGLMQTISETFNAYRSPALSTNIYDPLSNIYAGVNYAIHRYGNPGWLGVLGHGHGYALGGLVNASGIGAKWFDSGGTLAPGYTLAYNGTGSAETVIPGGGNTEALLHQLIAEVQKNTAVAAQQGAQFARGLNGSLTRGYYGR